MFLELLFFNGYIFDNVFVVFSLSKFNNFIYFNKVTSKLFYNPKPL